MDDLLRGLAPRALGVLVRRGHDFAAAEDAVQDALLEAYRRWPDSGVPSDPLAWVVAVAHRRFLDAVRSDVARHRREDAALHEPLPGPTEHADDTLRLLFLCCHPALSSASAVALTLRAVGGLTTRDIAEAFLVPETTMAQRISRAKKSIAGERLDQPGELDRVLMVLYLIYNAGHDGRRRTADHPRPAGSNAVAPRRDRAGRGDPAGCARARSTGAVSGAGGDRGAA